MIDSAVRGRVVALHLGYVWLGAMLAYAATGWLFVGATAMESAWPLAPIALVLTLTSYGAASLTASASRLTVRAGTRLRWAAVVAGAGLLGCLLLNQVEPSLDRLGAAEFPALVVPVPLVAGLLVDRGPVRLGAAVALVGLTGFAWPGLPALARYLGVLF